MVIAHQSENIQHPVVPNRILQGYTANCGSVTNQAVTAGATDNATLLSIHGEKNTRREADFKGVISCFLRFVALSGA